MTRTVLVVDDDEEFRSRARRMLSSCGYDASGEAGSVAEALRRAAESHPDVALVDIGLPDGDGLELSRRLSVAPWPTRVVLVSADGDASSAAGATDAGAEAFVPKSELSCGVLRAIIERDPP